MADKFVSSTGPCGTGNGSSEANAWSFANALANAAAGDYVWVKNDGVYSGTFNVGCSGSYTDNTHIYFIGYNNLANCDLVNHISDMDIGQPFWAGPMNPTAPNCWVDVNGQGAVNHIVNQYQKHNIHWRNFYFHNNSKTATYGAFCARGCNGVTFTKCKFCDGYINLIVDMNCTNCMIKHCYFSSYAVTNLDIGGGSYHNIYSHCVFNGGQVKMYRAVGCNSLFIGGNYGIGAYYFQNTAFNNTMYNQVMYCMAYGHNSYSGGLIEYNNIFIPAAKNLPAIYRNGSGTLVYSGYGCAYCLNENAVLDTPYAGQAGLNVNPNFANPAANDFRPRNPLVLRGGMPDFAGKNTQIGAVIQQYQFAKRSTAGNPARMAIFK